MKPPRIRTVYVATFAIALLVRLVHLLGIHDAPFFRLLMGDATSYDTWARTLAKGDWLGHEVFYQSPLYPYWLGALYTVFGPGPWVARIAQAVVGSATCVLVAAATARLFTPRAGLIAGLFAALYAPSIFLDALIQKSTLDAFFVALLAWLIAGMAADPVRAPRRGALIAGVVAGALALTRENALVIILTVAGWMLWHAWRGSTRGAARFANLAIFAAGVSLLLLPVAFRNLATGGEFHLTTSQAGPNFYIGNHAGANGTYMPLRPGRGEAIHERRDATELAEAAAGRPLSPREVSDYWRDRALDFIRSSPGEWMALMTRKVALFWNAVELEDTEDAGTHAAWSWPLRILGPVAHFGLLVPLAWLGTWVTWPRRRTLLVYHVLVAVYAASVVLFYVFGRYRYPVVPLLILFAAAGLDRLPGWWRTTGPRARVAALAATLLVALGCNWPMVKPERMRMATSLNIGKALQSAGRTPEAVPWYRRALEIDPGSAPANNNLAGALAEGGDFAAALPLYRRAVELRPDYADAHYNLGIVLASLGRADEAIGELGEALRLDPALTDAWYHRGTLLQSAGRTAEAIESYRGLLARAPAHAPGHYNLAVAFTSTGLLDSAITHFERALAIDPGLAEARHNLEVARRLRSTRAP